MRKNIISNLVSSGFERFIVLSVQFISSIIIIRTLPRDDYGIIGIVAGYFVFVSFLNFSFESIIVRDHKLYDSNLKNIMNNFFTINFFKCILFLIPSSLLSFLLPNVYNDNDFIYAIWSITFITISENLVAPYTIYFSSKFNQKLVTIISIIRSIFSLIILIGLFKYQEIWYIALKDFIVSLFFIFTWLLVGKYKLNITPKLIKLDYKFLFQSFSSFSFWAHFNGIVTNFIYRSDTFFLSFFASLIAVGNYTIALNSANVANVLPGILCFQNSIALSHANNDKGKAVKITKYFFLLSIIIGLITILCFVYFGRYYLYLLTGTMNEEIYSYMLYIVCGLVILKVFASPFSSFLCILDDVKKYSINVIFITFILSIVIYYYSAAYYGPLGIAYGNIVVSISFIVLLILHFKRRVSFS